MVCEWNHSPQKAVTGRSFAKTKSKWNISLVISVLVPRQNPCVKVPLSCLSTSCGAQQTGYSSIHPLNPNWNPELGI
jgi:hypothetical protein